MRWRPEVSIPASRETLCTICEKWILPGEDIDEVEGEWVHEKCAERFEEEG